MEVNKKLIAGIVLVVVLLGAYVFYTSGPIVTAQGQSSIEVKPDLVSVYISIEGKGSDLASAKLKHDSISSSTMANLRANGFSDEDIEIQGYSSYPEYDWSEDRQKIIGYVVTSQIVVKPSETEKVIVVVDSAIGAGAFISYINFELSDSKQNEAKKESLEKASADAKSKASATAKGLGRGLGSLVSIKSEDFYYQPYPYYAKAESDFGDSSSASEVRQAALTIGPGTIEVSSSVIVEYRLRPF